MLVTFKRERAAGLVVNMWVYDTEDPGVVKLVFVNDKATVDLKSGQDLLLYWEMTGQPGDELKVSYDKGDGSGFQELTTDKIPADAAATASGSRRNVANWLPFRL